MEVWKKLLIWKDNYISNLWRLKKNWKICNVTAKSSWYLYTKINNKKYWIHRLVAFAFLWLDIKNRNIFACHKNDIKVDNRLENLFIGTAKDNVRDMINKGRKAKLKYEDVNRAKWSRVSKKLTEEDVLNIRKRRSLWEKKYILANEYNIELSTMYSILHRETWRHI